MPDKAKRSKRAIAAYGFNNLLRQLDEGAVTLRK